MVITEKLLAGEETFVVRNLQPKRNDQPFLQLNLCAFQEGESGKRGSTFCGSNVEKQEWTKIVLLLESTLEQTEQQTFDTKLKKKSPTKSNRKKFNKKQEHLPQLVTVSLGSTHCNAKHRNLSSKPAGIPLEEDRKQTSIHHFNKERAKQAHKDLSEHKKILHWKQEDSEPKSWERRYMYNL